MLHCHILTMDSIIESVAQQALSIVDGLYDVLSKDVKV
jgi:hypothetical protein